MKPETKHKVLGWFWVLNFPFVTIMFFYAPETWSKASVLYLVYVSLFPNAQGSFSAAKLSKAEQQTEDTWFKKLLRFMRITK